MKVQMMMTGVVGISRGSSRSRGCAICWACTEQGRDLSINPYTRKVADALVWDMRVDWV